MNYRRTVIVALFVGCLGWGAVRAEAEGSADPVVERAMQAGAKQIEALDGMVKLSEEQKAAITEAMVAYVRSTSALEAKTSEKIKAINVRMAEASQKGDVDAIEQCRRDYEEVQAPAKQAKMKFEEQVGRILTPAQKRIALDARVKAWIKEVAGPIEFTEAQIKAIKAANTDELKPNFAAMRQAMEDVMTPAQRAQLRSCHAMAAVTRNFGSVHLTPEQLKEARVFSDKLALDPNLAPQEMTTNVLKKVEGMLSEEQKAALSQRKQN